MPAPATDPAAFEALLAPVLAPAYRFALGLAGRGGDAEDLVQEAALRAFRAFGTFQAGTNFKAWFYKILANCHFARHRRAGRRPQTVDLDDAAELYLYRRTAAAGLHALSDDPARLVMSKLSTEQVLAAIAALPLEYRAVAQLHLVDELGYDEIAELVGCPLGTVRSRLHRGRRMLQKALWREAESAGVVRPPPERPPAAARELTA